MGFMDGEGCRNGGFSIGCGNKLEWIERRPSGDQTRPSFHWCWERLEWWWFVVVVVVVGNGDDQSSANSSRRKGKSPYFWCQRRRAPRIAFQNEHSHASNPQPKTFPTGHNHRRFL